MAFPFFSSLFPFSSSSSSSSSPAALAVPAVAIALLAHRLYRVVYDLTLHPLSNIPGPRLAAVTYLYQTYYSLVGGSRFYIQVGRLHERYGPVVRITPDEVHLSDPDNYDQIYHVGSRYPKEAHYYGAMSCGDSSFTTMGNDEHRRKRSRLNPFFSKKKILELEGVIQRYAGKLCDMAAAKFARGEQLDLHHGFRAVSVDVITDYALNRSYDLLDAPDLGEDFANMWDGLGPTMWIFQQWPPMMSLANSMPEWMAAATSSALKSMFQIQAHCRRAIATVKADMASGETSEARETIFHHLLTPDPTWTVPSDQTLQDEAFAILGAAADTTGHAMNFATIEVVSDPAKYKRLHAELKEAFPDPNSKLDYLTLEKLPYLTGVIKEAVRLSHGSPGKLTRVVPAGGATFNGHHLPEGSFVSMGTWEMHHNETYWPDSFTFDPDRWANAEDAKRLEKAYVPFSKGSRMCIGINLAYAEMYITLGNLFRRFDNMHGTQLSEKDRAVNDYISSGVPRTAKRFHVWAGERVA